MEYNWNNGEHYLWSGHRVVVSGTKVDDKYPQVRFRLKSGRDVWAEGLGQISMIEPIPLCEGEFIGLGFQSVAKQNTDIPEYEILMHGAIKIRFMEVKNGGRDYYYLTNPCMGPIFFEFVHEVQRFLSVFQGAERRANIFKSL